MFFFSLKNDICKIFSNRNDVIFMKKTFSLVWVTIGEEKLTLRESEYEKLIFKI